MFSLMVGDDPDRVDREKKKVPGNPRPSKAFTNADLPMSWDVTTDYLVLDLWYSSETFQFVAFFGSKNKWVGLWKLREQTGR